MNFIRLLPIFLVTTSVLVMVNCLIIQKPFRSEYFGKTYMILKTYTIDNLEVTIIPVGKDASTDYYKNISQVLKKTQSSQTAIIHERFKPVLKHIEFKVASILNDKKDHEGPVLSAVIDYEMVSPIVKKILIIWPEDNSTYVEELLNNKKVTKISFLEIPIN